MAALRLRWLGRVTATLRCLIRDVGAECLLLGLWRGADAPTSLSPSARRPGLVRAGWREALPVSESVPGRGPPSTFLVSWKKVTRPLRTAGAGGALDSVRRAVSHAFYVGKIIDALYN